MSEIREHHSEAKSDLDSLLEKQKAGKAHLQSLDPLLREVNQKIADQRTVLIKAVEEKEIALKEKHKCREELEKVIIANQ